jgi:hypothetical protein
VGDAVLVGNTGATGIATLGAIVDAGAKLILLVGAKEALGAAGARLTTGAVVVEFVAARGQTDSGGAAVST